MMNYWMGRIVISLIISSVLMIFVILPSYGYIIEFSKSRIGILLFIGIPGLYLIGFQMWKLFSLLNKDDKRENNSSL